MLTCREHHQIDVVDPFSDNYNFRFHGSFGAYDVITVEGSCSAQLHGQQAA